MCKLILKLSLNQVIAEYLEQLMKEEVQQLIKLYV
jgi:hypothetical protein